MIIRRMTLTTIANSNTNYTVINTNTNSNTSIVVIVFSDFTNSVNINKIVYSAKYVSF